MNILDGVDMIDKVVFLATTNYPERLGKRIINRPSRFDKRFKIDTPNKNSRKTYFEFLFSKCKNAKVEEIDNIDKWVSDTDKMSIAHLKELFIAVVILGNDYDMALKNLKDMKKELDSMVDEEERERGVGFARASKKSCEDATQRESDNDDEDDDDDDDDDVNEEEGKSKNPVCYGNCEENDAECQKCQIMSNCLVSSKLKLIINEQGGGDVK